MIDAQVRRSRFPELRTLFVPLVSVLAFFALASCSPGDTGPSKAQVVGTWRPKEVQALDLSEGLIPAAAVIEFTSDGTWQANDGCNMLRGAFTLSHGEIVATSGGQLGSGCTTPNVEFAFLLSISRVVQVAGHDELVFRDENHGIVMRLARE